MWSVWGNWYTTAEMSAKTRSQKVKFNKNCIVRAARIWVIAYNDPVFTSLSMEIYSNNGGFPGKLLHTATNTISKSEMITDDNGYKEIYFEFNYPAFDADDEYHFVLTGTGYTGTSNSHLAWGKAFPDPVNTENLNLDWNDILIAPYQIYFIGSEFK